MSAQPTEKDKQQQSPQEMQRIIEKSRATPEQVNKSLDKVVAQYRSAIKELARR
jgi:hypothetical protein